MGKFIEFEYEHPPLRAIYRKVIEDTGLSDEDVKVFFCDHFPGVPTRVRWFRRFEEGSTKSVVKKPYKLSVSVTSTMNDHIKRQVDSGMFESAGDYLRYLIQKDYRRGS